MEKEGVLGQKRVYKVAYIAVVSVVTNEPIEAVVKNSSPGHKNLTFSKYEK